MGQIAKNDNAKSLGVALVGCGDIGWPNGQAVEASANARVVCTFDPNIGTAQDLARKLKVTAEESYEAVLARSDVDAVFLSVPHHLHGSLAVQAARAGKHLLIEKPLANTIDEANTIVSACQQANVKLTVNYSFRYAARNTQIRKLIADGAIGEPAGVSVQHLISKGLAYWAGGYHGRTMDDWRASKAKAGGGILIMGLVHSLDYIQAILKQRITKVYAEYATRNSPGDIEDTISLVCRFDSGLVGSWCASTCYLGDAVLQERLWGTNGTIVIKPEPATYFLKRRLGKRSPGRTHRLEKVQDVDFRAIWIDRFAAAVHATSEPEIGWRDGWHMTALVQAAYESQEKGCVVDVPEPPEHLAQM